MRTWTVVLWTGVMVLAMCVPGARAQGQAIDGNLEGTVKAQTGGAAIAGASVRAFNTGTGLERSVVSDDAGRFSVPLLPPGEYVVFVEATGYASVSQTGLALRAGDVLRVEFSVPAASFAESVQVTAALPVVETGRTVRSS